MGNKGLARETHTKKKRHDIIDESTLIEETRATNNEHTLSLTTVSRFDTQDV
jgi:hypothetical protein